jgi:hypothetical protein
MSNDKILISDILNGTIKLNKANDCGFRYFTGEHVKFEFSDKTKVQEKSEEAIKQLRIFVEKGLINPDNYITLFYRSVDNVQSYKMFIYNSEDILISAMAYECIPGTEWTGRAAWVDTGIREYENVNPPVYCENTPEELVKFLKANNLPKYK